MQVPVLLDCWAPWCQPCKVLMPILEKLTREYRGAFILAKLNIEDNQEIAAQLGVRSVPDVKLISQGGLVDHFQGALPEKELREWLGRYFPAPEGASASPEEQAAEALAQGDAATARALYEELVQQNPEHYPYQVELARALVAEERSPEALALLDNLPPRSGMPPRLAAYVPASSFARRRPATRTWPPWPAATTARPSSSAPCARSPMATTKPGWRACWP